MGQQADGGLREPTGQHPRAHLQSLICGQEAGCVALAGGHSAVHQAILQLMGGRAHQLGHGGQADPSELDGK